MKNVLAFVGVVAIVLTVGVFWALTSYLRDVNQVPGLIERSLATIEAAGPVENTVRIVGVDDVATPGGQVVLEQPATVPEVVVVTATPQPPTPTAAFEPTPEFSPGFLAACAGGMARGERVSPRCPSNAAEMLGPGR